MLHFLILPCLIRRCRFSVGKSVGRTALFDAFGPLAPSNCTERSIIIFLQMSLKTSKQETMNVIENICGTIHTLKCWQLFAPPFHIEKHDTYELELSDHELHKRNH